MRFHVVGLPNTQTSKKYSACAFTMKALNFCHMMTSLGHTVYHYGCAGSEAECVENVVVMSKAEQEGFFGPYNPNNLPSIEWTDKAPYWRLMNTRVAAAIKARKRRGDFVCVIQYD